MNQTTVTIIEAYERGYRVSECGEYLYTIKNKLTQKFFRQGYPMFSYRLNGKVVNAPWHRLQAYHKFGDKLFEKGIVVRHLNDNQRDCSFNNIEIGTQSDNELDKPKEVRAQASLKAAESRKRKYNTTEIKDFYNECKNYKKTMEKFDITSKGTLHRILKKKVKYS